VDVIDHTYSYREPKDVLHPQNLMNSIHKTCSSYTVEGYACLVHILIANTLMSIS